MSGFWLSRAPRLLAAAVVGTLAVTLLGPVAPAAADLDLIARKGTLTQRLPQMPAAGSTPAQQIAAASVVHESRAWTLTATVTLRDELTAAADLVIVLGKVRGTECTGDRHYSTATHEESFTRNGRVITLRRLNDAVVFNGDWDCAFVYTESVGGARLDGLGGGLTPVYGTPKLAVTDVQVLRKKQKRLKLVRGVWTVVEVTVANSSQYGAPNVRITGKGKGMQVKPVSVGEVHRNGGKSTVRMKVRLKGKRKKSKLRLTAASPRGGSATRTIRVKRVKPAKRPANGRYRAKVKGSKAKVTFRVKKGRVVNFRVRGARMTCRAPMQYPTYYTTNLTYPKKVKVPRSGVVDAKRAWKKGNAWYDAYLRMKASGKRVKQGNYTYVTANWCRTSIDFTARRVGR